MLGEIAALAGDPAAAAALWRGIEFGGGQLQVREWWYDFLGQPQAAEAIRQAERVKDEGRRTKDEGRRVKDEG